MSERDRDRYGSIVAFAVFVCLLIVAMIGWYEGFKRGQESHQSTSAEAYAQQANAEIQDSCIALSGVSLYECIAQAKSAEREQQRAEQNLDAQQQMAEWARWMLIVTVIMAAVTTFGVVFVWQTLKATQEMVKESKSVLAVEKEAVELEYRPILTPAHTEFSVQQESPDGNIERANWLMHLDWKNIGRTPARAVKIKVYQTFGGTNVGDDSMLSRLVSHCQFERTPDTSIIFQDVVCPVWTGISGLEFVWPGRAQELADSPFMRAETVARLSRADRICITMFEISYRSAFGSGNTTRTEYVSRACYWITPSFTDDHRFIELICEPVSSLWEIT